MTRLRGAAPLLALVSACYATPRNAPCGGLNKECPAGQYCSADSICMVDDGTPHDVAVDAEIDSPEPRRCFGSGLVMVCLQDPPRGEITTPAALNTDDAAMCAPVMTGSEYCVVAAEKITVSTKLRAYGKKPLVLIASDTIQTVSLIDVGSHRALGAQLEIGAGANSSMCLPGTPPGAGGSGGGAGGSFLGRGGAGGDVDASGGGNSPGAVSAATITALRGGCPGHDGAGMTKGVKGNGGGAVFLIAGNSIEVRGGINATGEGGRGALAGSVSGGGGGGSGGMIGFEAPTITIASLLLASGGGGGEGSDNATGGISGSDPTTVNPATGGGGNSEGGNGGNGSASTSVIAPGVAGGGVAGPTIGGGGGGGGGTGQIRLPVHATTTGALFSPPVTR